MDLLSTILGAMGNNSLIAPGLSIEKKGAEVSVSFPRNHPKAEKFLALAKELATRKTTDSGIEYNTGPNQGNVDKVMTILADIVDMELLQAEFNRQASVRASNELEDQFRTAMKDPYKLTGSLLGTPLAQVLNLDSTAQQRLDNVIKAKGTG